MKNEETKPLICPFCGAPQRRYIPTDTVQVKCQYCGGIFLAPPWSGGETYRCFNHPERIAIGKCNDCGESFCGNCLHIYDFSAESGRAILYLCPNCLRRRHIEKTYAPIYVGIIFLLFGIVISIVSVPTGAFMALIGAGMMIYGFMKRREMPEEMTIEGLRVEKEKRRSELAALKEEIDSEEVYNRLLTQYVNHWGLQTGTKLLENEIMAYTRHGLSFSEAVKKVYKRQKEKVMK